MYDECRSIGCTNVVLGLKDFCDDCDSQFTPSKQNDNEDMSAKYPQYYKPVGELVFVDIYAVHKLFNIQDPSGCIQHASKKLLLSGVRTGGKSAYDDIKEARDTLTRWLQLYSEGH